MVETGGLENRWARKGPGGSNPSSSATKHNVALELEGLPFRLRRVIARLFITVLSQRC